MFWGGVVTCDIFSFGIMVAKPENNMVFSNDDCFSLIRLPLSLLPQLPVSLRGHVKATDLYVLNWKGECKCRLSHSLDFEPSPEIWNLSFWSPSSPRESMHSWSICDGSWMFCVHVLIGAVFNLTSCQLALILKRTKLGTCVQYNNPS